MTANLFKYAPHELSHSAFWAYVLNCKYDKGNLKELSNMFWDLILKKFGWNLPSKTKVDIRSECPPRYLRPNKKKGGKRIRYDISLDLNYQLKQEQDNKNKYSLEKDGNNKNKKDRCMLVIETKVNSIATKTQIGKYKKAIERECKKYNIGRWGLVLLDIEDNRFTSKDDIESLTDKHFKIIDGKEIRNILKNANHKKILREYKEWLNSKENAENWLENRCYKILKECIKQDGDSQPIFSGEQPERHPGWGWRLEPNECEKIREIGLIVDAKYGKVNLEFWYADNSSQAKKFYPNYNIGALKKLFNEKGWTAFENVFFNYARRKRFRISQKEIKKYVDLELYLTKWTKQLAGKGSKSFSINKIDPVINYFNELKRDHLIKDFNREKLQKAIKNAKQNSYNNIRIVPGLGIRYTYKYNYFIGNNDESIATDILTQARKMLKLLN